MLIYATPQLLPPEVTYVLIYAMDQQLDFSMLKRRWVNQIRNYIYLFQHFGTRLDCATVPAQYLRDRRLHLQGDGVDYSTCTRIHLLAAYT